MSQSAVEQVLGKMMLDVEFRKLMASNLDQALAGYELTAAERAEFKNMDHNEFHQTVSGLDQRVSKMGLTVGGNTGFWSR